MNREVLSYREYQLTVDKIFYYGLFIAPDQKLVYAPTGLPKKEYTYKDFGDRVNRLGAILDQFGVKRGDGPWGLGTRVAILEWNTTRYQELLYAVPMYGAVAHTVNIRLAPKEIIYTLTWTKPEVLFIHTDFLQYLGPILENVRSVRHVVVMGDESTTTGKAVIPEVKVPEGVKVYEYEDLMRQVGKGEYPWPELDEHVVAAMFFTSGTTGLPKGVYHTHRQIVISTLQLLAAYGMEPISMSSRDIMLTIVPYFHVLGWGTPYVAFMRGIKMVFPGRYVWDHIAKMLVNELLPEARRMNSKVVAYGVPTTLYLILEEVKKLGITDLKGFQFGYGGAALPVSVYEEAKKMNVDIVTGYGPTETGLTAITRMIFIPRMWMKMGWDPEKMRDYFVVKNSLGVPVPLSFVKVVDENGKELPPGASGELLLWSPSITKEYFNDPEKTRRAWRFGYFDIEDMAIIDEYGSVLFVDRVKDAIKSGGEWIPSSRLEQFISTHPAVAEVAVIGAFSEKWGERPVAIITLRPGARLTEEELKEYLMKNFVETGEMPKWWIPDKVIIVQGELPKTSVGKIDKITLRERFKNLRLE